MISTKVNPRKSSVALEYTRGAVYLVDLGDKSEVVGSEQSGIRPCILLQNDTGNRFAPTIIVAPITKNRSKKPLPTHVIIPEKYLDAMNDSHTSLALLEQIRTVDKKRVVKQISDKIDIKTLSQVDKALRVSMGLY